MRRLIFKKLILIISLFLIFAPFSCQRKASREKSKAQLINKDKESQLLVLLPRSVKGYTLQSINEEGDFAQVYFSKKGSHIYSVIILTSYPQKDLGKASIKRKRKENYPYLPNFYYLKGYPAWEGIDNRGSPAHYLGILRDNLTLEIETHVAQGYQTEIKHLKETSRFFARLALEKIEKAI